MSNKNMPELLDPTNPYPKTIVDVETLAEKPGELVGFDLLDRERPDWDIYNPSIPFEDNGRLVQLLRHEETADERNCEALFVDAESRQLISEAPVFKEMQDPYYLGEFKDSEGESWKVIGGVKITLNEHGKIANWQDTFYRYKDNIAELSQNGADPEPFWLGQVRQKDTRLVQLEDRIGVFVRPQGEFGGAGRIGYFETSNLDTLKSDMNKYYADQDPGTLLDGVFAPNEWGGANQLIPQEDGTILVLGHRAWFDEREKKHYRAICFLFDPRTKEVSPPVDIARADDFPSVEPKHDVLSDDLVFTSGAVKVDDGSGDYLLYCGVGDRKVGRKRIPNPVLLASPLPEAA